MRSYYRFFCVFFVTFLMYHPCRSSVLEVQYSGSDLGYYVGTMPDGTELGFYDLYSDYCTLSGIKTSSRSLELPDSILYNSQSYALRYIGSSYYKIEEAANVIDLYLPATVTSVNILPKSVKRLHMRGYCSYFNNSALNDVEKLLVPQSDLSSYYDSNWANYVLINAEGSAPSKVTVNVAKPGEFAQTLLQQTDNWYTVNELTVTGNLNTDDLNVFKRLKQLTKLDLSGANISDIPNYFDGANSYYDSREGFCFLETLILPEVESIGAYAFAQCYRLKNVTIPKVHSIGYGAFAQAGFTQLTLPDGITSIDDYLFYDSNLESFNFPSSVNEIGTESFYGTKLTSIDLTGIKKIGQYAFAYCENLEDVKVAEGLEELGYASFNGCTSLTEIALPSSLRNINGSVFAGCTNLKNVTSRAIVPPATNGYAILYNCDLTDVKLYVPSMSIDQYRAENGWKTFYTILPLNEKTSNAYIYDNAVIDDATQLTDDCNVTLDYLYQNRNNSSQYYCGALEYNGNTTLSMGGFNQYHNLGNSSYNWGGGYSYENYLYNAHLTSLISNGTMRADNVQTTMRVPNTNLWYFISLSYDVKVSDIAYTEGSQFVIRKYSGQNRAAQNGDTWINLTADDVMHAYEGYILKCNKQDADFTFPAINNANKNKVFEKGNVVMPLEEHLSEFEHNRSWNLIGNPYPCYYDTRFIDFTAPITVWNRYNNSYDAYSPVDDSFILHPTQSFFVQRPVEQAAITFNKEGRQKDATVRNLEAGVKNRHAAKTTTRAIYNLSLSNGTNVDRTRFVINESADCAYELDKDASKFIDRGNNSMLLYTIEKGVKYAINERPLANGIVSLGFYAPVEGEYTLTLNTMSVDNIILIDKENGTETILGDEYRFKANAGYNDARFTLLMGEATDICSVESQNIRISTQNGVVSVNNAPFSIYTIDGRLVGNYATGSTATIKANGIYIINCKDVKRKIVVK